MGLKSDGTVVAVGWNYYGQCDVSGWEGIIQVSAGAFHTLGLKTDGTVVAAGWNGDGQCDVSGWNIIRRIFSGTVTLDGAGLRDVVISGLPTNPVTNYSGYYVAYADSGWSGTATPTHSGYTFTPASRDYVNVTSHQFDQDYSAMTITPVITVTSPNGGESWYTGTDHDITWTTAGTVGDVKIEYSINNGDSYQNVISSTTNDGNYSWTVPDSPSSQCLVRVSEASDGSPSDTSDSLFSIVLSITPTITVTSPNGGESWYAGTSHDITWTTTGTVGDVRIEYSIDNGGSYQDVITSTTNDRTYSWTVPNTPSTDCLVRISEATDGAPFDVSDSVFTIQLTRNDDILGTWGSGVWYRNSETGSWVLMTTPADLIAAGDLDDDGTDDLIGVWSSGLWVKYSNTDNWLLITPTLPTGIASGDMNGDGRDDILGTWPSGVWCQNSISSAWAKMSASADLIAAGDIDGDGTDDLIGTWNSGLWVKNSSTTSWQFICTSLPTDIDAGLLRTGWGAGAMSYQAPTVGVYAEGPGGWNFLFHEEENLIPQETEAQRLERIPGPGEPGFRYIEQKNLVPVERPQGKKVRRK